MWPRFEPAHLLGFDGVSLGSLLGCCEGPMFMLVILMATLLVMMLDKMCHMHPYVGPNTKPMLHTAQLSDLSKKLAWKLMLGPPHAVSQGFELLCLCGSTECRIGSNLPSESKRCSKS